MEKRSPKIVMEKGSPKFIMEKLSPKSPVIYERYKSGCAWGLISFLDFRQGHSNKKLISDRRHVHRHEAGNEYTSKMLKLLPEFDEKSSNEGVDKKSLMVGPGKAEAKKTMEEKMSTDQQIKKKITTAKVQHVQSDSDVVGHGPKDHRKASKTFWRPCYSNDVAIVEHRQPSHQNLVEKSSYKLKSTTTEEICDQVHHEPGSYSDKSTSSMKYDQPNEINLQVKMNEAAEAFINQKFIHGKNLGRDGASHQSKDFLDALQILNSNKELFIKLLQDPNSLLVKHIQELQDSQTKKQQTKSISQGQSSEYQTSNARECEEPVCTQNFKSCGRDPAKGSGDTSRIVLLKPDPINMQNSEDNSERFPSLQLHPNLRNKGQSVKPALFSFKHMKRKLRHAMGVSRKEQPCISNDGKLLQSPHDLQGTEDVGKGTGRQIVVRSSPSDIYLDVGGMANSSIDDKRRDKMSQAKYFESGNGDDAASTCENGHKISDLSTVRHPKQSESDIYVESRKHLFEMLSYRNEEFLRKRIPKTWGRITSLPEYDFLPTLSSRREKEHGSETAHMRFSPYSNYQMVNENKQKLQKEKKNGILHQQRQDVEAPPWADTKKPNDQLRTYDTESNVSEDLFPDTKVHENICCFAGDSSPRVYQTSSDSVKIVEINGIVNPGEKKSLDFPFEPDGTHNTSASQSTNTACMCEENGHSECSKLDSPLKNDTSVSSVDVCSSIPSSIQKLEDSDSLKDKAEQPSPVSVLENFSTEDVLSPASTICEPAEAPDPPIQIDNEEQHFDGLVRSPLDLKRNLSTSFHEQESTSEYVMAVLQASGFNWDELSMKCHSSDQLLNPSVCDEVEVWPNQSRSNCKLFFEYINEVFLEVYQCYFRCSPLVSLINPKIRPVPVAKDVVNEVMKCVDWDLISQLSSRTLEQLVEKDLTKAGTWLDIRTDMEDIVIEMVEGVLNELIMETSMELQI